jgi:hypothetical protein
MLKNIILIVLPIILFTSCGVISKNLIIDKDRTKIDGELLGIWESDIKDKFSYIIVQKKDEKLHISFINDDFKIYNGYALGYCLKINNDKYLNIQVFDDNGENKPSGYIIVNYSKKNNYLIIYNLNVDYFDRYIQKKTIQGESIYTKKEGNKKLTGIYLTDSTSDMLDFFKNHKKEELVDTKSQYKFYKIK